MAGKSSVDLLYNINVKCRTHIDRYMSIFFTNCDTIVENSVLGRVSTAGEEAVEQAVLNVVWLPVNAINEELFSRRLAASSVLATVQLAGGGGNAQ